MSAHPQPPENPSGALNTHTCTPSVCQCTVNINWASGQELQLTAQTLEVSLANTQA